MEPGIYLVHKPVGPTSFSALRAIAPTNLRSCHGGTLDPFASGLLLILIEPATQLFDLLHDIPKVYEATIRWGIETDNGDPTGKIVATGNADLSSGSIEQAMQSYLGWHDQIPPATSARRIDGERAYVRAHRGESVELPAKSTYLHHVKWLDHQLPEQSRVRVTVRGGFYVRALVRDLGRSLGCTSHLRALRRIAIGPWTDLNPGEIIQVDPLPWLATRRLDDAEVIKLKTGEPIERESIEPPTWHAPNGFPSPATLIRGVHVGRFNFMLEKRGNRLHCNRLLRGGISL